MEIAGIQFLPACREGLLSSRLRSLGGVIVDERSAGRIRPGGVEETRLQVPVGDLVGALDPQRGGDQAENGGTAGPSPAHAALADGDLTERTHRRIKRKQKEAHAVNPPRSRLRSGSVPSPVRTFIVYRSSAQGPYALSSRPQKLSSALIELPPKSSLPEIGLRKGGGEAARLTRSFFAQRVEGIGAARKARLLPPWRDGSGRLYQGSQACVPHHLRIVKIVEQQIAIDANIEIEDSGPKFLHTDKGRLQHPRPHRATSGRQRRCSNRPLRPRDAL